MKPMLVSGELPSPPPGPMCLLRSVKIAGGVKIAGDVFQEVRETPYYVRSFCKVPKEVGKNRLQFTSDLSVQPDQCVREETKVH